MPIQSPAQEAVENELTQLSGFSISVLRKRWRSLFPAEPSPAFGPDLLRRSIAQKLQENAYGKLSSSAQRELNRIVASLERNPAGRIELPQRIKPGAALVRDWKGKSHHVTVLDKGFTYEQRTYPSLSEIAREITGTRWNGPRFFGLRPTDAVNNVESKKEESPKRGRPPKATLTSRKPTTIKAGYDR